MSAARPRIGVTGPDRGGYAAWLFTRWALARAGARAVRITPRRAFEVGELDGLVLGGGADVSEPLPSTPPAPSTRRPAWPLTLLDLVFAPLVLVVRWLWGVRGHGVDPARDRLELSLLDEAQQRELPVLGICRGAQLMTLFGHGSLVRNVGAQYEERPELYTVLPRREVCVEADSRLRVMLGADTLRVNSLHFHAVAEPGEGMRVVARERSGVPQAVEHTARPFWVGVQWHPEYLLQHETQRRLFEALVAAARGRAR